MRVRLTNLGCKLNQAEIDRLARELVEDGHRVVDSLESADLHIVNSCTVTHVAARTSRKASRRAGRRGLAARTVLTGCYVSGSPEEAAALAGVDMVVPNDTKHRLRELVYERFPEWRPPEDDRNGVSPYMPLEHGHSRALVKIEDGCNMSCSFCIIPRTRGRQRSRPGDEVVAEVARMVDGGFREIVLTGVQISSYRDGDLRLASLVRRLLAETGVERLRLTSIAPWDFEPELLDLVATGRVCRHFHLSLQSGCDRTLVAMRRPYDTAGFAEIVDAIRERIPGTAITTDLIVGFPGETPSDFETSIAFVREMRFARIHAFPYSPRPGTSAAALPGSVSSRSLRERMHRALSVAASSERDFQRAHLGETLPVLWEDTRDGVWRGTSDNYLKVSSVSDDDLGLRLVPTLIERLSDDAVVGRPLLAA